MNPSIQKETAEQLSDCDPGAYWESLMAKDTHMEQNPQAWSYWVMCVFYAAHKYMWKYTITYMSDI